MKSFETGVFEKDFDKVRHLSSIVRKKILESNPNYERKIDSLKPEELEDLDNVLGLAEQIMLKYQEKKDAYLLIKEFADLIRNWTISLGGVHDEIQELLISAKSSVSEIETAQNDVSTNLSFGEEKTVAKQGTINLTKSITPVYTQEYQATPQIKCEQVV